VNVKQKVRKETPTVSGKKMAERDQEEVRRKKALQKGSETKHLNGLRMIGKKSRDSYFILTEFWGKRKRETGSRGNLYEVGGE